MEDIITKAIRSLVQEEIAAALEKLNRSNLKESGQCRCSVDSSTGRAPAPVDSLDMDFADMPARMSARELASFLPDTEPKTLENWRGLRFGPAWVRPEGTNRIYYLKSDVVQWVLASRQEL